MGGLSFLRVTQAVGDEPVTRFAHPFHAQRGASAIANQSLPAVDVVGEGSQLNRLWRWQCVKLDSFRAVARHRTFQVRRQARLRGDAC